MVGSRPRRHPVPVAPSARAFALTVFLALWAVAVAPGQDPPLGRIPSPPPPAQFREPGPTAALVTATQFIQAASARAEFQVSGKGVPTGPAANKPLTVAVLDTGLNTQHVDFAGRVGPQKNFTTDNMGPGGDATDGNGHGTNVAGIIAAGKDHTGMAPGARIIPLKVLANQGGGGWQEIIDALDWVLQNHAPEKENITVVNVSISDSGNHLTDDFAAAGDRMKIRQRIRDLRAARVAVVVAAGNDYFTHAGTQGMGFPAICRECTSVGAVYDGNWGSVSYESGASAFSTRGDQITPFSQRLHRSLKVNNVPVAHLRTDIFAPGAPIKSSGIDGANGESIQSGTSQASPVAAGVIVLMQELYMKRRAGARPAVDDLERWLDAGAVTIGDPDKLTNGQLYDNVAHTNLAFPRINALSSLQRIAAEIPTAVTGDAPVPATAVQALDPGRLEMIQKLKANYERQAEWKLKGGPKVNPKGNPK